MTTLSALIRRPWVRAVLAGLCLAGSVPPWGWWPLAFVGVALIDDLVAGTTPAHLVPTARNATLSGAVRRFGRVWLATAVWLFTAMLWMWDLTPPGYIIASAAYAAYFGLVAALIPPQPTPRRLILPGAVVLAEAARWYWPFGGVPLANLALSQVDTPIGRTARLAGPLLVIALVVVLGQSFAAFLRRDARRGAWIGVGLVALAIGGAIAHPRSTVVRDVDAALVQGGGPTRTRASSDQEPVVLARHIEATRAIEGIDVDFILWPENVVNPGRYLTMEEAEERTAAVAATYDTPLLAGWFHALDEHHTVNYQTIVLPDGTVADRYDKVRTVPFGEFVPLRDLIESLGDSVAGQLPRRDALSGSEPPVLNTPVGPVGVSISWEAYFERRSRDAVEHGAQILTNPTNGSSYWLTHVHTQQVASNQLRAIENDRWVLMVGPTGLSAVIEPDGVVQQRTGISERRVLFAQAEMRTGRTLASVVGPWPMVLYGVVAVLAGLVILLRSAQTKAPGNGDEHPDPGGQTT